MAKGSVRFVNPDGLVKNPAFSQIVEIKGPVRTIYIGAQNSVDGETKSIVGEGDVAAQTAQTLKNIDLCLEAGEASKENIISWNIYIKEGEDLRAAFGVGAAWLGQVANPPLNNVMYVASFPRPEFLISIEAVVVVPESD